MGSRPNKQIRAASKYLNYEEAYIINQLQQMKWKDRIWKVFCFRFEYRIFGNKAKSEYEISWEDFRDTILEGFSNYERNYYEYFIFMTFKKFFEQCTSNSVRLYRIYMLFFSLVNHPPEVKCLDFLDLFYEKIIYNLEVEIFEQKKLMSAPPEEIESSQEVENIVDNNVDYDNMSPKKEKMENDYSSHRLLDKQTDRRLNNVIRMPKECTILNAHFDEDLLRIFQNSIESKREAGSTHKIVKTFSLALLREIMYVYFQNNITLILKAFKTVLSTFDPNKYDDLDFVKRIKYVNHEKIRLDHLTPDNIYKFIDLSIDRLLNKKKNLVHMKNRNDIMLTLDDIYVFIEINPFYFDTLECLNEFMKEI